MKDKKIKDLLYSFSGNIVSLLAGVITAFIIPKLLGDSIQYKHLQVFNLYLQFVGFFHFGFNDGILVRYGGLEYDEVPKKRFRAYFSFLIILETIVAILIIFFSIIFIHDIDSKIIYFFISINLIFLNITTYFDMINQFTRRFKLYSINMILAKCSYVIGIVLFILFKQKQFISYILLQTGINAFILIFYAYNCRDLILGIRESIKSNVAEICKNISVGFFVMIGNFMGMIIVSMDRILVQTFLYSYFGLYSFGMNLLNVLLSVLNAVNPIVFPYLKRVKSDNHDDIYETLKIYLFMFIGICMSVFFIVKMIVLIKLPKFVPALNITLILFPTILFNGQISIVSANYYKVLRLQKEYTFNNIFAFIISLITISISYLTFKNVIAVAFGNLVSFFIWSIFSDYFFYKKIGANTLKLNIVQTIFVIMFLIIGSLNIKWYNGFILYIASFTTLIMLFYRHYILNIKSFLKGSNFDIKK